MNRAERRANGKIVREGPGAPAKATLPPHPLSMPTDWHGTARPVRTFSDGVANELRLLGGPQ
jgi:hypothetical protein